jgi:UDPglucose 6-dehydrogenase
MEVIWMKICVVGSGYVGLTTGACFSELGNHVVCVDKDRDRIDQLKKGIIPIYEQGLTELVGKNLSQGTLEFTTELRYGVIKSDMVFIAVGTPSLPDGNVDLSYVKSAAVEIAGFIDRYKIIVNKSTVPVGTQKLVTGLIKQHLNGDCGFDVVSNPEFLREGSAIADTMNPDRVIIGADNSTAAQAVKKLYEPMKCTIMITSPESAEMIKYASNAFLATKISFINDIANLCERVGASIDEVAQGMGLDKRIGNKFLKAGIGFGGSCLPKDTMAIAGLGKSVGYNLQIIESVIDVNERQKLKPVEKLLQASKDLNGKTIGVLGLAFKPGTDDIREAPSIRIINEIQQLGGSVKAYDPIAMPKAGEVLRAVEYCRDPYETAAGADAVVVVTEWAEFAGMDLARIKSVMKSPLLIDGRNLFDPGIMKELGFEYHSIGRA